MRTVERYRVNIAVAIVVLSMLPAVWIFASNRDIPQLGTYQDDGLYLIAAKSINEHRGFRILNLPGEPFQTKYQPVYSLLLALIWSIDAGFPGNLALINICQGLLFVAFIALSGLLFRSLRFSAIKCAVLCSFLALSPWVIYWATVPISDYLFAALVVSTFCVLNHASKAGRRWFFVAGAIAAAAYLTKSAGLLIVPAVIFGSWRRRDHWSVVLFLGPILPVVAGWMLWAHVNRTKLNHPILWYYTDYVAAHVNNGGLAALREIISSNILSFTGAAGSVVIYDLPESLAGRFLSILVTAALFTGGVRVVKRTGSLDYPIFCALFTIVLCVWNFSPNVRLMLPLLPLLAIGLYLEAEVFAGLIRQALKQSTAANRFVAYLIIACALAGSVHGVQRNTLFITRSLPDFLKRGREWSDRSRTAFRWCQRFLPASSIVLASDDTLVYLYTGLKSVRPVPNSVAFYKRDHAGMMANFTKLDELSGFFGITHILIGPNDYMDFEPEDRSEIFRLVLDDPFTPPME
jgi:hypothetical protein